MSDLRNGHASKPWYYQRQQQEEKDGDAGMTGVRRRNVFSCPQQQETDSRGVNHAPDTHESTATRLSVCSIQQ